MNSTATRPGSVTSADGTAIAYETAGRGPALVLVDGALCHRAMGPSRGLAKELAGSFTAYAYDGRGRGDSGAGASPWTLDREVEDLAAVIDAAGGEAFVLGVSSGASLVLEAARRGVPMMRLAAYEAPFILDGSRPANDVGLPAQLRALVDAGRRGEVVKTFMRVVGAPAAVVALMPLLPAWKRMVAVAHTLPYDLSMVIEHQQGRPLPAGHYDAVAPETLVIAGGKSPEYMRNAQAAIAAAVPHGRLEVMAGQTHMVKPTAVAPLVTSFFLR